MAALQRNNRKSMQEMKEACDLMRAEQTQLRIRLQDEMDRKLQLQHDLADLQRNAAKDKKSIQRLEALSSQQQSIIDRKSVTRAINIFRLSSITVISTEQSS